MVATMKLLRVGPRARGAASRATLAALALLACALLVAPASASAAPLSIKVEGNHFVDGEGQTIRLLGVNTPSSEYACAQNYAFYDGYFTGDAAPIASWNADAVRVPLNEDCWLNTNLPNGDPYGGAGYQHAIEQYVAELNAHGLYAILDLHWSAPGNQLAGEQQPMPDKNHSITFWEGVAGAFKGNPAVVFDVFNEPYDPTDPRSGDDQTQSEKVTWECWKNGTRPDPVGGGAPPIPCVTAAYDTNGNKTTTYEIAGMQSLVDAIRGTGATQPIMIGGLNFANDLTGWIANEPTDPLGQLAASFHNYMGTGKCDDVACWNSQIAPVAASVPVVTGEFAEDNYEEPGCNEGANNFDNEYMGWADGHGVSYLAWAWIVPDPPQVGEDRCDRFYLLGNYNGTPASVNGIAVHAHLLSLPPGGRSVAPGGGAGGSSGGGSTGSGGGSKSTPGASQIKLTHFSSAVETGGAAVAFKLEVATSCKIAIAGQTVKAFGLGGKKKRKVSLGSAAGNLVAGKPKTVVLQLPAKAQALLRSQGSLPASFTLTLTGGGATTTSPHTVTLKEPKPKSKKDHKH
jgi:endoglucanase